MCIQTISKKCWCAGSMSTAVRVVSVVSVDGRCLTGQPGRGGITVTPCAAVDSPKRREQLWWLNRNARTMTALVNNGSNPGLALQVNHSDWRSVSLERLSIPRSYSGVPGNVNTTFTQDWYWDQTREGRLLGGTFANSIEMAPVNCDPQVGNARI